MASHEQFIDVEQEYQTNKNLKREDINILRKFIETQNKKPSDLLLFLILHCCYYDMELAKNTLVSYYKIRSNWPEVFTNRNPSLRPLRDQLNTTLTWPLKQRSKEEYPVFYSTLINFDHTQYDLNEQAKQFLIIYEYWLNIFGNAEGISVLFDSRNISLGHLAKYGIGFAKKFTDYVQDGFPIRLKAVHFINTGVILEKILLLFKMFMKKELQDLIHVHSNFESLHKCIPKSCLPKDYGGDDVTIQELHEEMISTLLKNAEFFEDEPQEVVEEKFRYLEDY